MKGFQLGASLAAEEIIIFCLTDVSSLPDAMSNHVGPRLSKLLLAYMQDETHRRLKTAGKKATSILVIFGPTAQDMLQLPMKTGDPSGL